MIIFVADLDLGFALADYRVIQQKQTDRFLAPLRVFLGYAVVACYAQTDVIIFRFQNFDVEESSGIFQGYFEYDLGPFVADFLQPVIFKFEAAFGVMLNERIVLLIRN